MSGIYIHIPFCKQACHYCDFHFSTNLRNRDALIAALITEISLQKNFFPDKKSLHTLYFGGGTPSLLTAAEIAQITNEVAKHFSFVAKPEITLEANPDDLNDKKISELKSLGINRLSIGIQSFHEPHLKTMNRAHNAKEAENCLKIAQKYGFDNISIDLIYGIPAENHKIWKQDLEKAIAFGTQHLSAYCLTVEPHTALAYYTKKGTFKPADDEFAAAQFEWLCERSSELGFEQYEISNFAKNNAYSRHNSMYWQDKPYLGIGPSAHSYNGKQRLFNPANNRTYIVGLSQKQLVQKIDERQTIDQINEYMLTSIRTIWGCDLKHIKNKFKVDIAYLQAEIINNLKQKNWIFIENCVIFLTKEGKLFADEVSIALMLEKNDAIAQK
ncbi:MAG: radical SAM family heme chaperone HemW [Bernardetiaceae bacterium]|nr:radical SAM family heme chaperone HemW [Bernardetiaceae bacterium]